MRGGFNREVGLFKLSAQRAQSAFASFYIFSTIKRLISYADIMDLGMDPKRSLYLTKPIMII